MTDISVEESIRKLSEAVNQISHAVAATVSTSRYSQLSTAINNQLGVMEAEIDNLASDVEALDAKVELLRVNATQIDDETPAGTIGRSLLLRLSSAVSIASGSPSTSALIYWFIAAAERRASG